ncbi:MAG: SMC-Scp complex subunit ScpB [Tissierellaceae bacterium]
MDKVGRPIIYGTTDLFLRSFGLESLENLPSLEEFNENMENIAFEE